MEKVVSGLGISLLISIMLGPILIPVLHKLKFGQYIRAEGPQKHLKKAGTPTMGGIMFLTAIGAASLLIADKTGDVLLVLAGLTLFGLLGFIDDYIKVVMRRNLGLRARHKLVGQFFSAALMLTVAVFVLNRGTDLIIPFGGQLRVDLGVPPYLLLGSLVIVATTNAVNLTDGLDGLAAGVTAVAAVAYIIVALMMGKTGVAVVAAAVAGGCIGFLRYNAHPAKVFMGDTGSLALGGALAGLAVVTKTELFLPIIGIVYVLDTLSVIIQVISFKTTGKRVFLMSPLHHHYELKGWSEWKIVIFFWLLAVAGAVLGILGMYESG
ncbi:phospho-N-acetylmuramoyl-pentapeptide-transferase [Thermincola potens]|uniref:Phospho-N-acetylmuramoyl-pentapeptide-transferase n=1 Tax=Thermincola potens (strain JR) TaxID=635013 RepID=D5X9A4_THEPJ|nr:phospho-N-acetylmuramoyl-pentapeptide-transferase [Thermincola potens JR]